MFYSRYYEPPKVKTIIDTSVETVDQSEARMCGLRYQLDKFGLNSLLSSLELQRAKFGYADTRLMPSFEEQQNKLADSIEYFDSLPSQVRRQFGDKPKNFFKSIEKDPIKAVKDGFISKEYAMDILHVNPDLFNPVDKVEPTVVTQPIEAKKELAE